MAKPIGVFFHCPGIHDVGCPDKASLPLVMQTGRWSGGLTVKVLFQALTREGWILANSKLEHASGSIDAVDPLCPKCGPALLKELDLPAGASHPFGVRG